MISLTTISDAYSRQAESLSDTIDKHLCSSSVELYWNGIRIKEEQNTTRINQLTMEEKKVNVYT